MFVCLCKGVTDTQIQESVQNGASSLKDVRRQLGVATQCCKCLPQARALVDEALANKNDALSASDLYYSA